jgi:hypothetical protein
MSHTATFQTDKRSVKVIFINGDLLNETCIKTGYDNDILLLKKYIHHVLLLSSHQQWLK